MNYQIITFLLALLLLISIDTFAQKEAKTFQKNKGIYEIELKTKALKAVEKYISEYLDRNVVMDSTFHFSSIQSDYQIKIDTLQRKRKKDTIIQDTSMLSAVVEYCISSDNVAIDTLSIYLDKNYNVLDSNGLKLNTVIKIANGEIVSINEAKQKVKDDYADALWYSIELKRGKVENYARKGYEVGKPLYYYYFQGRCNSCSYQIIKVQLDAETAKVASEYKEKID